jgi:hypothetical protein
LGDIDTDGRIILNWIIREDVGLVGSRLKVPRGVRLVTQSKDGHFLTNRDS